MGQSQSQQAASVKPEAYEHKDDQALDEHGRNRLEIAKIRDLDEV